MAVKRTVTCDFCGKECERWFELSACPAAKNQEKRRRLNARIDHIEAFALWLAQEPPMWRENERRN